MNLPRKYFDPSLIGRIILSMDGDKFACAEIRSALVIGGTVRVVKLKKKRGNALIPYDGLGDWEQRKGDDGSIEFRCPAIPLNLRILPPGASAPH